MNKADLVKHLTLVTGQRREAERVLEKLLEVMKQSVQSGEKVVLSGFGSFYPKIRRAQKRHNPKTMQPVHVPPKRTVKFIPSEELFGAEAPQPTPEPEMPAANSEN